MFHGNEVLAARAQTKQINSRLSLTPCSWGKALAFEELRCGRAVGHTGSALGRPSGNFHMLLFKCLMKPNDLSAEALKAFAQGDEV